MKRHRYAIAILLALWLQSCSTVTLEDVASGQSNLLVATFNVHYLSPRATHMDWARRQEAVVQVLRDMDADIVLFQEMETFNGGNFSGRNLQLDTVRSAFPEYEVAATGEPAVYPSTQPILYRHDELEFLEQGFFFFSPTPDDIYSRPWHKRFPAFLSWSRFRRKADDITFYVYNLHTDASSPRNRMKTARLVVDRLQSRAFEDDPVIVGGDFNAPALFPSMRIYRRAGLSRPAQRRSTFHFNRGLNLLPAIDHVITTSGAEVVGSTVVRRSYDDVWPSDHYPVLAAVKLRP